MSFYSKTQMLNDAVVCLDRTQATSKPEQSDNAQEALTDRQASRGSHAHDAGARKDRHPLRHSGDTVVAASHDQTNVDVLLVLEVPQLAVYILHINRTCPQLPL